MSPSRIEIFCRRRFRVIHRHPDVHMVNKHAEKRPHLALPHEHSIEVTVCAVTTGVNRVIDLLDLQNVLDANIQRRRPVINWETCSFEMMCAHVWQWFEEYHRICRVCIDADQVEGAILEWEIK